MSDFQQTITSLNLLHTSLYRMELFQNAQAVKNVKTDVISLISLIEKAERERDYLRIHNEQDGRVITDLNAVVNGLYDSTHKAERERDELRKTLQATQGGATEAIKNVMRLQEEISRLDKESQSLSDQLGACDQERRDWIKRALTAEAEIARRDAAAGEPVAYQIHSDLEGWRECTPERYAEVSTRPLVDGKYSGGWLVRKLYTAAPPAVLPELEQDVKNIIGLLSGNEWAEHCTNSEQGRKLECEITRLHDLRSQHQKVVELYKRKSMEVISGQRYSYVLLEDLLPELDAAGVKWEVKK